MYLVDKGKNRLNRMEKKQFIDFGFKERDNLQEWIANEPSSLGEDLLIIQKEFDGFSDTKERLDLLALDKDGNLVIIENKLDDSGKDVTWQALKYASYCSSLSKSDIVNIYQEYLEKEGIEETAEQKLAEFFEQEDYEQIIFNKGFTQRIMLVAANFRKEVTSTVLWLLNFRIRIQCFKVSSFTMNNEIFFDIEQIIPVKDAEDYIIKIAEKAQDDLIDEDKQKNIDSLQFEFWGQLLKEVNNKNDLFQRIHPQKGAWLGGGSGMSGVPYNFVISKSYARVELYIDKGDKEENKKVFDFLYQNKEKIDEIFKDNLTWEKMNEKRASRIKFEKEYNCYNKENWNEIIAFLVDSMVRFEKCLKDYLKEASKIIKTL